MKYDPKIFKLDEEGPADNKIVLHPQIYGNGYAKAWSGTNIIYDSKAGGNCSIISSDRTNTSINITTKYAKKMKLKVGDLLKIEGEDFFDTIKIISVTYDDGTMSFKTISKDDNLFVIADRINHATDSVRVIDKDKVYWILAAYLEKV